MKDKDQVVPDDRSVFQIPARFLRRTLRVKLPM